MVQTIKGQAILRGILHYAGNCYRNSGSVQNDMLIKANTFSEVKSVSDR